MKQEEQIRAAWYAPQTNPFDAVGQDDQFRVISVAEAGGPSHPLIVTCGEKQVLTTLEAPTPKCTETLVSIHLLLSTEQKLRPALTLAQLKENCVITPIIPLPLGHSHISLEKSRPNWRPFKKSKRFPRSRSLSTST